MVKVVLMGNKIAMLAVLSIRDLNAAHIDLAGGRSSDEGGAIFDEAGDYCRNFFHQLVEPQSRETLQSWFARLHL
jgi:hypothetical protein